MPDEPRAELDLVVELRRLLRERGWTVRKLRAEGFGGVSADKLLGMREGLPSIESADRALRLVGRRLWHQRLSRG
jgi:hypothetical protein